MSDYAMKRWDRTAISSETLSHLALAHVKITGKTENPRDTVIYCNGTNRVIHSQISRIENLTVSNGWHNSGTGGAGVLSYNATSDNQKSFHSNVVVTCCTSAAAGGGVYYGVWYDSVITSNRMTNAGSGGGGLLCKRRCFLHVPEFHAALRGAHQIGEAALVPCAVLKVGDITLIGLYVAKSQS